MAVPPPAAPVCLLAGFVRLTCTSLCRAVSSHPSFGPAALRCACAGTAENSATRQRQASGRDMERDSAEAVCDQASLARCGGLWFVHACASAPHCSPRAGQARLSVSTSKETVTVDVRSRPSRTGERTRRDGRGGKGGRESAQSGRTAASSNREEPSLECGGCAGEQATPRARADRPRLDPPPPSELVAPWIESRSTASSATRATPARGGAGSRVREGRPSAAGASATDVACGWGVECAWVALCRSPAVCASAHPAPPC